MSFAGTATQDMASAASSLYNRANNMLDCIGAPMRSFLSGVGAVKNTTAATFSGKATSAFVDFLDNIYDAIYDTLKVPTYATYVQASGSSSAASIAWLESASGLTYTSPSRFQEAARWDVLDAWLDLLVYATKVPTLTAAALEDYARENENNAHESSWGAAHYETIWDDCKSNDPVRSSASVRWAQFIFAYTGTAPNRYADFTAYINTRQEWAVADLSALKGTLTKTELTYEMVHASGAPTPPEMDFEITAGGNTVNDTVESGGGTVVAALSTWPAFTSGQQIVVETETPPADSPFIYAEPPSSGYFTELMQVDIPSGALQIWWTIDSL